MPLNVGSAFVVVKDDRDVVAFRKRSFKNERAINMVQPYSLPPFVARSSLCCMSLARTHSRLMEPHYKLLELLLIFHTGR